MLVDGNEGPLNSTMDATLKILDIGLGGRCSTTVNTGGDQLEDPGITGEGCCSARPITWPPEQARDARNADIRADIYSLGCVLFT